MRLAGRRLGRFVLGGLWILVAAFCAFYAYVGGMAWWQAALLAPLLAACGVIIAVGPAPYVNELTITPEGVARRFGHRLRRKKEEKVRWDDLTRVEIETTDAGPFVEDFHFVLHGSGGKGVLVGNDLAVRHGLVSELQARLPGLDNRAIVEASGCTENRSFLLWQKPPR